jgi:hypothetical protein
MSIPKQLRKADPLHTVVCRTTEGSHMKNDKGDLVRLEKGTILYAFPGLIHEGAIVVYLEVLNLMRLFELEFLSVKQVSPKHLDKYPQAQALHVEMVNQKKEFEIVFDKLKEVDEDLCNIFVRFVSCINTGETVPPFVIPRLESLVYQIEESGIDPKHLLRSLVEGYKKAQMLNAECAFNLIAEKRKDEPAPQLEQGVVEAVKATCAEQQIEERELVEKFMGMVVLELLGWLGTKEHKKLASRQDLMQALKTYRPELVEAVQGDVATIENNLAMGLKDLCEDKAIVLQGDCIVIDEALISLAVKVTTMKEQLFRQKQ